MICNSKFYITVLISLIIAGCLSLPSGMIQESTKIQDLRKVISKKDSKFDFEMLDILNWYSVESRNLRHDAFLPKGVYSKIAEDTLYNYFEAPKLVKLSVTKNNNVNMSPPMVGGIFFAKDKTAPYPAGIYIDIEENSKMLVMKFNSLFLNKEGDKWRFINK